LQLKLEKRFNVHLAIIKVAFYQFKNVGLDKVWVLGLFSNVIFYLQRFLFVLSMTNNVKLAMHKLFDVNPITKL
jgi:hypothetical protein